MALGIQISSLQDYSTRILANSADSNSDGSLTQAEFTGYYHRQHTRISNQDLETSFHRLENQSTPSKILHDIIETGVISFLEGCICGILRGNRAEWPAIKKIIPWVAVAPTGVQFLHEIHFLERSPESDLTSLSNRGLGLCFKTAETLVGVGFSFYFASGLNGSNYFLRMGLVNALFKTIFHQAALMSIDRIF